MAKASKEISCKVIKNTIQIKNSAMIIWYFWSVKKDAVNNMILVIIWLIIIQVFLFPYYIFVYFSIRGATTNLIEKGTDAAEKTLKV